MKVQIYIVLATVLVSSFCEEEANITSFLYTNENGETWLEDLTKTPNLTISADDVMLYLFTQKSSNTGYGFRCDDVSNINKTSFNAAKPTVFVIHGWQNSHTSQICKEIKTALVNAYDINVFTVDWNSVAKQSYITAHAAVAEIGGYVAKFVKLLEKNTGLQVSNVKMVGHSLGAHVAGNAGYELQGRLASIMGLDPAGPLFTKVGKDLRLDSTDAQFVEGIHTNAAILGVNFNVGHADYWPNGGKFQPGCNTDLTGSCSHARSYLYFAESVKSNRFVARQCDDYNTFTAGNCKNNAASSMGMFLEDTRARGSYFLNTKSSSPFAEG